jgi:hypothetical protein
MNQKPIWFVEHPNITFIDHTDILPNLEYLPTFNSQAIESNLHRIPGLCEHFIYFNDDVFLGRPVSPYDFFTPEGNVKVLFENGLTVSPNPAVQATLYRKAWVNSSALLDSYFVREKRQRLCHAPFALRKSWIEEVEQLFPFVFTSNASHRFRSAQDFNLVNGLLQYIWKYQGKIERGTLTNKMLSIYGDNFLNSTQQDLATLTQNPLHTFCIQDLMTKDSEKTRKELYRFFQTLFPNPASWEPTHRDSDKPGNIHTIHHPVSR